MKPAKLDPRIKSLLESIDALIRLRNAAPEGSLKATVIQSQIDGLREALKQLEAVVPRPPKVSFDDLEESFNCPYCGSPYGRRDVCCGESSSHGENHYALPDWSAWMPAGEAQDEIDRINRANGYPPDDETPEKS